MKNHAPKATATFEMEGGGAYFVSNYPPYGFWSPDAVPSALDALQAPPEPGVPLGVYMHIPFCRQRCHFCYFKVYTGQSANDVNAYMRALSREAKLFSELPRFAGRKPRFLYLGGGTPSYISQEQFHQFMVELREIFPLDEVEEFTLECEPGTVSLEKLKAFKHAGVTRASLGVEHFDDRVLAANNRAHNQKAIYQAFENTRAAGFSQINIDLIAGMPGDGEEAWSDTVAKTLELLPESVTIYQLEFPFNTTFSKFFREHGQLPQAAATWETKRRWVDQAFETLEQAGYELTSGYTARRKDSGATFVYRDALWTGADMLGLGVSAFSHVHGHHFQNEKDMHVYIDAIAADKLAISRGYSLSSTEAMIRELILQLKRGSLRSDYFQNKFGVDLNRTFEQQLRSLDERGLLKRGSQNIELTREGLLRVDTLLPSFFLPEHIESHG